MAVVISLGLAAVLYLIGFGILLVWLFHSRLRWIVALLTLWLTEWAIIDTISVIATISGYEFLLFFLGARLEKGTLGAAMGGWGPFLLEAALERVTGVYSLGIDIDVGHRPLTGMVTLICHQRRSFVDAKRIRLSLSHIGGVSYVLWLVTR